MPCLQLIINAIPIAAGIFVKYSFFRKLGFGKDYLEGLKEGIRTAKKCKKWRTARNGLKIIWR